MSFIVNPGALCTFVGPQIKLCVFFSAAHDLSELVESALSGTSMENLIQRPSGCGEQNINAMTFPVIATTYLDKTRKWEDVGFRKRNLSLTYVKAGRTQ